MAWGFRVGAEADDEDDDSANDGEDEADKDCDGADMDDKKHQYASLLPKNTIIS